MDSRKHYRLVAACGSRQGNDGRGELRKAERAAREQAHAETLERFGGFTPDNAAEALRFQETRANELLAVVRAKFGK